MSDVLVKIKRAVLSGRYVFSEKARLEMEMDGLTELDVAESIVNAVAIYKKLRSRSPFRQHAREYLYIIQSCNLEGVMVYTKGKLMKDGNTEIYYFLISSKKAL
ncbi:MAG: hypothetical protein RBT80_18645 [Candidatus Vecturithrix sp.]|jgi:hypothetical protein|nr:hypothetical protein [Candidatus Vecturithrix sp.]